MMISFFRPFARPQASLGEHKYSAAVDAIDDLIAALRSAGSRHRAAVGVAGDVLRHRDNVPYMTTMYEANAEMRDAAEYRPNGKAKPASR